MPTAVVLVLVAMAGLLLGLLFRPLWQWSRPRGPLLWGVGLVLILSPAGLWDPPPGPGARHLRVLSVLDSETTDALLDAFQERTGIVCEVDPFAGGAQRAVDLLLEQRLQPDLFLGGTVEIHQQLADIQLLHPCSLEPDGQRIDEWDHAEHLWTPIYVGYLALIHRPLPALRARPPEWITLLDPRFRNQVTIPSPMTSGGGLVFLATQLQRAADPERGWAFMASLLDQGASFESRSENAITQVAEGRKDLGVAWAHDVWRRRERDRIPVDLHIPDRTGYEVGGVSILASTRDAPAAEQLVRFLTGRQAGQIQVRVGYRVPLRQDVDPPPYLIGADPPSPEDLAFFDRSRVLSSREEWIERWLELVEGQG